MLVLASQSPRRKELLSLIADEFEICPAKGEEIADASLPFGGYAVALAEAKAREVFRKYPDAAVIGADTIVALDGEILGKPKDTADARRMLRLLSGRTHAVFTGTAVMLDGKIHSFHEETRVTFFPISDGEIERYIASGEPFDKAGAYGIQGKGAVLVEKIDGDYYNVMGLPIGKLCRLMRKLQII